jgi:hypothetical protein
MQFLLEMPFSKQNGRLTQESQKGYDVVYPPYWLRYHRYQTVTNLQLLSERTLHHVTER